MNKRTKWFYALLSSVLLYLAWPPFLFAPILFFAIVPLLLLAEHLFLEQDSQSKRKLVAYTFVSFGLWNALSTWWIYNASPAGIIAAIILNGFLMSLPFFVYHQARNYFSKKTALLFFISSWMCYEYFHLNWDLSWPWLNLGNGFSELPEIIQWYEYTGTAGGTLWILLSNCILFLIIHPNEKQELSFDIRNNKKWAYAWIILLIAPVTFSIIRYVNYSEKINPCQIVIVQPNIDPYNEKFDALPMHEQMERLYHLSDSLGEANTEFFIWPETAISNNLYEDELTNHPVIADIRLFLSKYKNGNVLTGANTYLQYERKETPTARLYRSGECCYDAFNTALQIENDALIQVYHKSKLVPGVEQMPYPQIFKFLEKYAVDLGGISGSLGKQDERTVFYTQSGIGAAPVICYESVYGEYMNEYVIKGAQFIAIVTNDGWWGNTPGYKQHASYARLRAIETRRSIARSANTGISSFINQRGDVISQSNWWTATALKKEINLNDDLTFYTVYGDYLSRISVFISGILFLFYTYKRIRAK